MYTVIYWHKWDYQDDFTWRSQNDREVYAWHSKGGAAQEAATRGPSPSGRPARVVRLADLPTDIKPYFLD